MALSGWIKLHRALSDHWLASNPDSLSVWVHMLMLANHAETKRQINGSVVVVLPGQIITSRRSLSEKTGVQESKVERILKRLESEQQITQRGLSKFRVISIVNWAEYQSNEQQSEQQVNSKRTAGEQQVNTPEECKKPKECKEVKSPCPQRADDGHKFRFAEIQEAYNRICSPALPACRASNETRRRQVKRMAELEFNGKRPFREHGLAMWESYFSDCLTNKHWTGDNDRQWRADFDFVTNPKNAIKLLERVCD